ncbi:MAG: 50S ribosomal protein L5 [Candidatus Kerfeldbacteria bacterium]|nr:50S ribosomal protein L5 [Candidatus Kerfeldbacteria bacterium]
MTKATNNLKDFYFKEVVPQLKKDLAIHNNLAVPRLVKAVVNVGLGRAWREPKLQEVALKTLERITGQKPVLNKARKSISNFKIRQGMVIGASVTLRGGRMYDFLQKLVQVALPRVRDFRGLSLKALDKQGNLSIGFKEHIVFPEIKSDEIEMLHGLEVAIVTTAVSREQGQRLFELLGFPLAAPNLDKVRSAPRLSHLNIKTRSSL